MVPVDSSYASLCSSTVTSNCSHPQLQVTVDNSWVATALFLTAVNTTTKPEDHGVPKWNFAKADWQKFSAPAIKTLSSFSISLDYAYCLFETSVREAALEAVLESNRSLKIAVP